MHTENINFKDNVYNCVFSTHTLYRKCGKKFLICYVLEHLWHNFESYGFRKC